MNKYAEKAMNFFTEGYNCSQSVFLTFAEEYGMDRETALKISSSFGGGMGRLREVCGAVSGMFMTAGLFFGYCDPSDYNAKKEHYKLIQELAEEFKKRNGSIICRELLGTGDKKESYAPEQRSLEYYKKRPCRELVGEAAEIIGSYIEKNV